MLKSSAINDVHRLPGCLRWELPPIRQETETIALAPGRPERRSLLSGTVALSRGPQCQPLFADRGVQGGSESVSSNCGDCLVPKPPAAAIEEGFRRVTSCTLIRRRLKGQPTVAFTGKVRLEVGKTKLNHHRVLRLCATSLRRLRGPVVGGHRGVPLDRLQLSRTFSFGLTVPGWRSLVSSINCC